jgi:hypothetical protein
MRTNFGWEWTQAQAAQTAEVWRGCKSQGIEGGQRFTAVEQREREAAYDEALHAIESELRRAPASREARRAMRERAIAAFGRFSAKALELEEPAIALLTEEFLPVGTTLARFARSFDPDLPMDSIIQACRNAWTACGMQPLLGHTVRLTPSILAYSLLYPYSDNNLDDQCMTSETKLRFSERFRQRLSGESIVAGTRNERAISKLVELIEGQYSRERFPQVYECLLSIHRAQEQSLSQMRNHNALSDAQILRVSCEKGGSSVLADACLSHPLLSDEQSRFAFEWGVLLQLGDDLQDVREDLWRGSMTMFSHAVATEAKLDGLTMQLLRFAEHVGKDMDVLPHGSGVMKRLLKSSWRSLIVRAIADSYEFFSPAFVEEAERYSPFRFDFLRQRQKRINREQGLYRMMFDAFLEDDSSGDGPPPQSEDWSSDLYQLRR